MHHLTLHTLQVSLHKYRPNTLHFGSQVNARKPQDILLRVHPHTPVILLWYLSQRCRQIESDQCIFFERFPSWLSVGYQYTNNTKIPILFTIHKHNRPKHCRCKLIVQFLGIQDKEAQHVVYEVLTLEQYTCALYYFQSPVK